MTFEEIKAKWFDLTHFTTDYDSVDRLHFADKYMDFLLEIAEAAKLSKCCTPSQEMYCAFKKLEEL